VLGAGCAATETHEYRPTLSLEKVAAVADGISLDWFVFEATLLGADGDLVSPKPVSRFTVERQTVRTGEWSLAATLPASAQSYLDRDVEGGTRYLYRITSHFVDGATTSFETADPVTAPPLWSFKFVNPVKSSQAAKGMVYVKIAKFEKGVGKVEAKHVQVEGDRLGFWEETPGAEPTGVHRVNLPTGEGLDVDFNTGATLKTVLPAKVTVDVKRCKPVFDIKSGERIDCFNVVEKRVLDLYQVTYRDAGGLHPVTVPDPDILHFDQVCDYHREYPDEPMKDPRLLRARLLLDEADFLWDFDAAASIRIYQRLLKDYRDIVILLQVRNRVEGRARQGDDR
jgi:hypothetical protein